MRVPLCRAGIEHGTTCCEMSSCSYWLLHCAHHIHNMNDATRHPSLCKRAESLCTHPHRVYVCRAIHCGIIFGLLCWYGHSGTCRPCFRLAFKPALDCRVHCRLRRSLSRASSAASCRGISRDSWTYRRSQRTDRRIRVLATTVRRTPAPARSYAARHTALLLASSAFVLFF